MVESPMKLHIKSTQTLDAMLHSVLNQALVMIEATAGSLMLVDSKQGILQIKARLGVPRAGRLDERVFRIDDRSIASTVARERRSHICANIESDPLFLASRTSQNFLSILSVPIIHDDQVLAVINADSPEAGYFTADKQQILEELATQAATPIAERVSLIQALAEVGYQLTLLPRQGGVDQALTKIADLAVRSLGADVVTVYQYDQAKDEFLVEGTGPTIGGDVRHPQPMQRKVYPGDVPWTVVKDRRPGFYYDVVAEEFLNCKVNRPGDEPRPRFVEREGVHSMAALLLPFRAAEIEHEEVVGVMFANYRTPHVFNIDEIAALATFADYAAVAIANARREEERRAEQMQIVESISASFAHAMTNLAGPGRVAVQLIREQLGPVEERIHSNLRVIEHEADLLMALAERLRGRIVPGDNGMARLTDVDVGVLLRDEIDQIGEIGGIGAETPLETSASIQPDLPHVESVEFQLKQVLHDLIRNAVEAIGSAPGGRIDVLARVSEDHRCVEIEVSDNGVGISEEALKVLFQCGVTSKKDGLGVGLWYSRTFLRATGGDIRIKATAVGTGTTFLVEVPIKYSSAPLPAGSGARA